MCQWLRWAAAGKESKQVYRQDHWLMAGKPVHTACSRETSCLGLGEGKFSTLPLPVSCET